MKQHALHKGIAKGHAQGPAGRLIQVEIIIKDLFQVRQLLFGAKSPDPGIVFDGPGFKFALKVNDITAFVP